jgi:hypothetical protein
VTKLHPKLRTSLRIILASILFIQMITPGIRGRVAKAFAKQQFQACPSCQMPVEDHFLNFAYFVESGDLTSTLALNNNTRDPQNVQVTIFNHRGDLFQLPPLSLPAQQTSRFSLHDLLKDAKGDFNSGNLRVFYHAIAMGVTGQVTVTSAKHRYSFDSYPTEAMMFASTRLNGILWLPDKRTEASVALTNTASTALTVTISSGQDPRKREKNINLNPRETNVVNLREFVTEPVRGPSATLLSLTHNGAPGDLITTGFALNDQNGFASNLLFVDRATATSNKLAGAHVRIGQAAASEGFPAGTTFSAPLVVANPSDLPSEAHVAVDYTIDDAPHRVELAPFTLAAQEIKQIDLAQELARRGVSGPVDEAGVDLSYSGQAGAVIGRLTSVDGSGDYSFDVPIKDPLAGMNRVSGSYPWRLDQGYTTVLHLKNTIDKEVTAIVQVRYDGGNYNPELIKLAPYQTVAIDIRELRDAQRKDIRGGVMPNDVTSGQVIWYEREKGSLIGRAEIFNVGVGVADSFSCQGSCPCPSSFRSTFMSPTTFISGVGNSGLIFRPQEMDSDCHSNSFGPFDMTNSVTSWSSTDTSIATVDSGGIVSCVGPGSGNILATFSATVFGGPPGSCNATTVNPTSSGGMTVEVPTSVTIESLTFSPGTIQMLNGSTSPSINVSTSQFPKDGNGNKITLFVNASLIRTGTEGVSGNLEPSPQLRQQLVDGGSVNILFGNLMTIASNNYCGTVGFKAVITDVTDSAGTSYTNGPFPRNVRTAPQDGRAQNLVIQCPTPPPQITSLSRTSGPVGAQVTINGLNFGAQQGSNSASFNGVAANVTSWSNTSINVTVPSGATTGQVVVVVSSQQSNGILFTVQ